jgi:hypothetical protein
MLEWPGVVSHFCYSSTRKAKTGVWGQLELHSKTLSQKKLGCMQSFSTVAHKAHHHNVSALTLLVWFLLITKHISKNTYKLSQVKWQTPVNLQFQHPRG